MGPMRAAIRRMRVLTLLLAVTAFSMVGCIRYELGFVVNADGSGALSMLVAISDQFAAMTGTTTEEALGIPEGLPGAEISEYSEDGFTGIQMAIPFANLQQLGLLVGSSGSDALATDLELQPDGQGGWSFATVLAPTSDPSGTAEAPPPELLQGAWGRVRVQLPGEIAEHNADRIEDGAFVWDIDFTSTEPRQLMASTTGAAADGPAAPETGHGVLAGERDRDTSSLALVAVAAMVVVLAARAFTGRRRRARG